LLEQIARLVKRSPGSLAEKERNLTGTRPNAAAGERALFRAVIETPELVFMLWAVAVAGAREAGIGPSVLPDVLDAETTDGRLLGQDELDEDLRDLVAEERGSYEAKGFDPETSERAAVTMARLGQHRFSVTVRDNYNRKCGFCGLDTASLPKSRLLVASHVKPWRDGTTEERLDPRNGIAACPTHDAAFDTGLLTITNDGRIHTAQLLREATERDRAAHAMFTRTVSDRLIVEAGVRPKSGYLTWHQERIWRNGVGAL
jgi:putative restriction endonuclease